MQRPADREHPLEQARAERTRRWFFRECGVGLGTVALGQLLGGSTPAAPADPLAPKVPHFAPRAKRVIYLFMAGGPSQLELFDHKPELAKWGGKLPPAELLQGLPRRLHLAERDAARAQVQLRPARGLPAPRSRSCSPTWPGWPTTSPS